MIDEAGTENAARLVVAEMQVLEQALRHAGPVHGHLEALAGQHRLRGVLQSTALPAMSAGTMVLMAVR